MWLFGLEAFSSARDIDYKSIKEILLNYTDDFEKLMLDTMRWAINRPSFGNGAFIRNANNQARSLALIQIGLLKSFGDESKEYGEVIGNVEKWKGVVNKYSYDLNQVDKELIETIFELVHLNNVCEKANYIPKKINSI